MESIGIAIVGAGNMAHEHARAFASLPGVRIAGVCGRTRERAESLAGAYGAPCFETVTAMYEATRADVVVVAVNELSVRKVCHEAFPFPWLIFLEKPVGHDLSEAEAITAEAQQCQARAYVALNRRAYSATRQALTELESDSGPRLISVTDQQDLDSARAGGQPDAVVKNYMFANSIHLIDYFHIFGRGEVVAVDVIHPWDPDRPGIVAAGLRFSSGDVGIYQAVWNGPGPWSVAVTNPAIRTELRPLERLGVQRRGERKITAIAPEAQDSEFKPGLRDQAMSVLSSLRGEPTRLVPLAEATRSMDLCARIYRVRG